MNLNFKKIARFSAIVALLLSHVTLASQVQAQVNGISLTLAASEPTSYDHGVGGGQWSLGRQNVDIRYSLEGENFRCNELVSYLMKVHASDTTALADLGLMSMDMTYSISMDTTGQSGVALSDPVSVAVNIGDPANFEDGDSTASIVASSKSGPMFSQGSELSKVIRLTGLEAGETIVYRFDVTISCAPGTRPTGNLQVKLINAALVAKNDGIPVNPPEDLNSGNQTISLKNIGALAVPSIVLSKTVTSSTGNCPGDKTISIEPTQEVKFCYVVTNNSNNPNELGAPLYNVTKIFDDNGKYPDFQVSLSSGLTDIDSDGQVDDLAVGASAYGSYVVALDGDQDSTVVNTAAVSGYDLSNGGSQYTASDTATVYIDAPALLLTISKLTNGEDGATFLVGTAITWSYLVTNTGDRDLSNVYVSDNQGVAVTCPASTLAIGASMTCTASGIAIAGNYSNTGTAVGSWNGTTESATDVSSYFGADPKIDIQKSPKSQLVTEGEKATFSITVSNLGNVPLTGVVVTDPLSSDCDKIIGTLGISEQQTYSCTSSVINSDLTNVASVAALYGTTQVTDSDSANVTVDYLPNISVTKSASLSSVLETGGSVTFTFSVKNNAPEDFILTTLVDDTYGDLNGQGNCGTPQTIASGATYSCTLEKSLSSDDLIAHVDILTATGRDPQGNPGSGSDDAIVTFIDVLPSVTVTKTGSPSVVPESGGNVTFTFVVKNESAETLYLSSIVDDKFGDLNGKGTCLAPQTIVGFGTYTCAYTKYLGDWTLNPFDNTVTVVGIDNEGNRASDSDSFQVNFTDLLPQVALTKSANPTIVRSTGDFVDYSFTMTNTGPEIVVVTSFTDPSITLSPACIALINQMIPLGGTLQCVTRLYMVIGAGTSFVNTATVVAKDNENNSATVSASATIKSYWFGRSPGFWKNHPQDWKSGYSPTMNIQDVFNVPSSLLSAEILDLDGNRVKDTLMAGLNYKGGSGLTGAAQILFRASVAALLNESYYGADFPAESSVTALITRVNSVLATQNRASFLALAAEYDKWNNGVEGPLP